MLDLLKKIAWLGYLEEWPGSGDDLISLLRGVDHLQKRAIWAGIRNLEAVGRWHPPAAKAADSVPAGRSDPQHRCGTLP